MRHNSVNLFAIAISLAVFIPGTYGQNVGVETLSPDSTLSIKNKVEIGGAQGDILFTDDEGSITFPATSAPNSAMINMFSSGFSNADRMVIAHSPTYQTWGLQYKDASDEFHFIGDGDHAMSLSLASGRAAIGQASALSTLFTLNVQSSTEDRTGYFYNTKSSSSTTFGIYAGAFGTGTGNKRGGSFDAVGGSGINIGVRANSTGSTDQNFAMYGIATGNSGQNVAVRGDAGGGSIQNVALYANATGGTGENIGVYANVSGTNSKAAYFDAGNVIVDDRIGIGTDAPVSTTKLHVVGDIRQEGPNEFFDIRSTNTSQLNGIRFYNESSFQGAIFYDSGNDRVNITGGSTTPVLVTDFGSSSVAIGTFSPATGYKLSVDGKITGEELRIRNSVNWPDFVFADEYDLMTIDELEQSINAEGHLPGVPSAEVVAEEGIMVGDMQKLTMQKIEELTLYIIELNKENKALRQELQELKKEVSQLPGK